jgi:hypothetical protein
MAAIIDKRLVEHLQRASFIIIQKPPICGSSAPRRGHGGR